MNEEVILDDNADMVNSCFIFTVGARCSSLLLSGPPLRRINRHHAGVKTRFQELILPYSCLRASTGCNRAARRAGTQPATSPMARLIANDSITEGMETVGVNKVGSRRG